MLDQEIQFYQEHLEEWLGRIAQRFVLVKGRTLVGTFDTMEQALSEGARQFGRASFLVRRVEPEQKEISIPAPR